MATALSRAPIVIVVVPVENSIRPSASSATFTPRILKVRRA
jgi:hypothetical protein